MGIMETAVWNHEFSHLVYLFNSSYILKLDSGPNSGPIITYAVKAAHPASSVSHDREYCPVLISGTANRAYMPVPTGDALMLYLPAGLCYQKLSMKTVHAVLQWWDKQFFAQWTRYALPLAAHLNGLVSHSRFSDRCSCSPFCSEILYSLFTQIWRTHYVHYWHPAPPSQWPLTYWSTSCIPSSLIIL